jgi:Beta-galactosidase
MRMKAAQALLFALLLAGAAGGAEFAEGQGKLPKVLVRPDGKGFVTEDGKAFVPFGVTYFRPGTGWAPQVWKQFDAEATRKDFAKLRELGGNCVRVFLSFGSFYEEPGRLSTNGLAKFDQFLALAEQAGLYVQPTGPDHWEGLPAWARDDRYASEKVVAALDQFWKLFATRYRGRNVLFAYELLNEPEIGWDTPELRDKWHLWLQGKYGNSENLRAAWGTVGADIQWESAAVPDKDAPPGKMLLDYQHFREVIADQWTSRQVAAIKAADPRALVTVGLIQWSVPIVLAGPFHYSGFRPERQARWLDFMEVHFYPLADGFYDYKDRAAELHNLAYLECVVREVARCGKPTVLGEFGWYGGGKLTGDGGSHPSATEEQQARWCKRAVETSADWACGWLNWGFYDHPEARDVTELIGLLKPDGKLKSWGSTFQELAGRFQRPPPSSNGSAVRPAMDYDLIITDNQAKETFRKEYFRAFESEAGKE